MKIQDQEPFVKKRFNYTLVRGWVKFNENPRMEPEVFEEEYLGIYTAAGVKSIVKKIVEADLIIDEIKHTTRDYLIDYETFTKYAKFVEFPFKKRLRNERKL